MIPLAEITAARDRLAGAVVRTPLVHLEVDAAAELYLKLENLQPIGSFKLRGAGNALALASPEELERGVWTASAGNMAQGVAWWARRLGVRCTCVVPDTAPETKLAAIRRLGSEIVQVPFDEWWEVFRTRAHDGLDGRFVHAFSDEAVMAGNGTIGLEVVDDLPDVDAIVIPYGGGGLTLRHRLGSPRAEAAVQSLRGGSRNRSAARPLARSRPADQRRLRAQLRRRNRLARGLPRDVRADP